LLGALRFGLLQSGRRLPSLIRGVAIFDCCAQPTWWWHSATLGKTIKQAQSEVQQRLLEAEAIRKQVPAAAAVSFGLGVATATSLGRLPVLRSRGRPAEESSSWRVAPAVPVVTSGGLGSGGLWASACLGGFASSLFTLSCAYAACRIRARCARAGKPLGSLPAVNLSKATCSSRVTRSPTTTEPEDEPAALETPKRRASTPRLRPLEAPPCKVRQWRSFDAETLSLHAVGGNLVADASSSDNRLVADLVSPMSQEMPMGSSRPACTSPFLQQLSVESSNSAHTSPLPMPPSMLPNGYTSVPVPRQLSAESGGFARTSALPLRRSVSSSGSASTLVPRQVSVESSGSASTLVLKQVSGEGFASGLEHSDDWRSPLNVEPVDPHTSAGRRAALWSASLRLKIVQNLLVNNAVETDACECPSARSGHIG